jgi:hypothetical protein
MTLTKKITRLAAMVTCVGLSACSSLMSSMMSSVPGATETPRLDAKFGDSVRSAKAAMIINPNAAQGANAAHALDGNSANSSTEAYQKSFAVRPVVTSEPQASGGSK